MRIGIFDHMDCAHRVQALVGGNQTHGHTYKVEVVLEGPVKDGLVMDFKELRDVVRKALSKYDHKDLSDFFEVPSCETICQAIFEDLKPGLPGLRLVRCWEGYNKWAETEVGGAR